MAPLTRSSVSVNICATGLAISQWSECWCMSSNVFHFQVFILFLFCPLNTHATTQTYAILFIFFHKHSIESLLYSVEQDRICYFHHWYHVFVWLLKHYFKIYLHILPVSSPTYRHEGLDRAIWGWHDTKIRVQSTAWHEGKWIVLGRDGNRYAPVE